MEAFLRFNLPSLLLLAVHLYGETSHESVANAPFPIIFQFGDSLSDTGNGVAAYPDVPGYTELGLPPYGETFFKHPTGRDSDGRLIVDFLAMGLGLPMLEPFPAALARGNYSHGADFAVAGAAAVHLEEYAKYNVTVTWPASDLDLQLQRFLDFQKAAADGREPIGKLPDPSQFSRGLYIVGEIGGNDYKFMGDQEQVKKRLTPLVVKSTGKLILSLYEAGARRFLVINMPLQGCVPDMMTKARPSDERDELGCVAVWNRHSHYHNALLKANVEQLRRELHDATISFGDLSAVHKAVLQNPHAYGFSEPLKACCGTYTNSMTVHCAQTVVVNGKTTRGGSCSSPTAHVHWDSGHFTDHFNSIAASAFLSLKNLYVQPPSSTGTI